MPPSPPGSPSQKPVVLIESPRDAATRAIVYRRGTREKPRERWLKIVAAFGAWLVHMVFLFSMVFGSAYDLPEPPPEPKGQTLEIKLINKKPEPPPPPPVRGIPPKEHGPLHRGAAAPVTTVTHATQEPSTAAPVAVAPTPPQSTPPVKQPPVVSKATQAVAEHKQPVAAPIPPISLPTPAPIEVQAPKLVSRPPPPVTTPTPVARVPIPPPLQPEPARKPQLEGNRPMPPLPSLALPDKPTVSPPEITPPHIATQNMPLEPVALPNVPAPEPAPAPAAPKAPETQPVPLPAQQNQTVEQQPSEATQQGPIVPRPQPQLSAPPVQTGEIKLPSVPMPTAPGKSPDLSAPPVEIDAPKLSVTQPSLQPQLNIAPVPLPAPSPSLGPATPSESNKSAATHAPNAGLTSPTPSAPNSSPSAAAGAGKEGASTAPNATPNGSETANPGEPNGSITQSEGRGAQPSPATGNGSTAGAQGSEPAGTPNGSANGTYTPVYPHGDTEIMSHRMPNVKYNATRFDQYWTPKGESSVDTALRHAVEKTTVNHTFNLPHGVRIGCTVMPLMPMALLGCHNPDPPAVPLHQDIYNRLNLPSKNASIPKVAPPPGVTTAPAPAAPVNLDNSAECAAARVSGGPLPPNCPATTEPVKPIKLPASPSSGSWVPASDQFH